MKVIKKSTSFLAMSKIDGSFITDGKGTKKHLFCGFINLCIKKRETKSKKGWICIFFNKSRKKALKLAFEKNEYPW